MAQAEIFDANPEKALFEKVSQSNGETYWFASDLMVHLGYENKQSFRKAIMKAQSACLSLNIRVDEHFIGSSNPLGKEDTRLSRFACYLTAMNADPRLPNVAKAQAYFVAIAESVRHYLIEVENVERVQLRGEITDREKSLSGIATKAGVVQYGLFQNAGYLGMYNMHISQLRRAKGIPDKRSPLDFMGKTELAANLFRITQTEEKIRSDDLVGQPQLEYAAQSVGMEVRKAMYKISGRLPEELSCSEDIKEVKKSIKLTSRKFKKLDKKK